MVNDIALVTIQIVQFPFHFSLSMVSFMERLFSWAQSALSWGDKCPLKSPLQELRLPPPPFLSCRNFNLFSWRFLAFKSPSNRVCLEMKYSYHFALLCLHLRNCRECCKSQFSSRPFPQLFRPFHFISFIFRKRISKWNLYEGGITAEGKHGRNGGSPALEKVGERKWKER